MRYLRGHLACASQSAVTRERTELLSLVRSTLDDASEAVRAVGRGAFWLWVLHCPDDSEAGGAWVSLAARLRKQLDEDPLAGAVALPEARAMLGLPVELHEVALGATGASAGSAPGGSTVGSRSVHRAASPGALSSASGRRRGGHGTPASSRKPERTSSSGRLRSPRRRASTAASAGVRALSGSSGDDDASAELDEEAAAAHIGSAGRASGATSRSPSPVPGGAGGEGLQPGAASARASRRHSSSSRRRSGHHHHHHHHYNHPGPAAAEGAEFFEASPKAWLGGSGTSHRLHRRHARHEHGRVSLSGSAEDPDARSAGQRRQRRRASAGRSHRGGQEDASALEHGVHSPAGGTSALDAAAAAAAGGEASGGLVHGLLGGDELYGEGIDGARFRHPAGAPGTAAAAAAASEAARRGLRAHAHRVHRSVSVSGESESAFSSDDERSSAGLPAGPSGQRRANRARSASRSSNDSRSSSGRDSSVSGAVLTVTRRVFGAGGHLSKVESRHAVPASRLAATPPAPPPRGGQRRLAAPGRGGAARPSPGGSHTPSPSHRSAHADPREAEEARLDAAARLAAPDLEATPALPLDDVIRRSILEHRSFLSGLVVSLRGELSLLRRAEEAAGTGLLGRAALDAYLREASEIAAMRAADSEQRALRARAWSIAAMGSAWPAHEAPPVVGLPASVFEATSAPAGSAHPASARAPDSASRAVTARSERSTPVQPRRRHRAQQTPLSDTGSSDDSGPSGDDGTAAQPRAEQAAERPRPPQAEAAEPRAPQGRDGGGESGSSIASGGFLY